MMTQEQRGIRGSLEEFRGRELMHRGIARRGVVEVALPSNSNVIATLM